VLSCTVTATNTEGSTSATSAAVNVPAAGTTPPGLKPGPCANVQAGTGKADKLTGTTAGDKLVGRGGNDVLRGLGNDDCLVGGGGKDKVVGDKADTLVGCEVRKLK
jgi:Ca2+-binding RTX toxin-like protein